METQVNETTKVTPRSTGIRFGLISGLIAIVYFLILNLSGLDMTNWVWNLLSYVIVAAFIFFAHQYYKKNGDGFMAYGQGIGIAFWLGLISGAIASIFTYLYIKFIDAGFIEMIKQKQIQAMQEKGMSDEQIDKFMDVSSIFTSAEAIFFSALIGSIASAIIIALIVTIFTQKKNPEPAF